MGRRSERQTAEPLTEEKFDELLEPGHLGQSNITLELT